MANLHCVAVTSGTIVTTTEFIICTMVAFNVNQGAGGQGVYLKGDVLWTPGTAATAATYRIRQGNTITGTTVFNSGPVPVTASALTLNGIQALDATTVLANGMQYVFTVQQTAATGNGSVGYGVMTAESANVVE